MVFMWTTRTILVFDQTSSWYCKTLPKKCFWEKSLFDIMRKMNEFIGGIFSTALLCQDAPARSFSEKLTFLEISDMPSLEKFAFPYIWWLFQKWLPRPNHYAHETRSEILCKTPVSILRDLSPRPQNHRKTSKYSFLAWMSTWTSRWQRRRRRRRRRPKNSPDLGRALIGSATDCPLGCTQKS